MKPRIILLSCIAIVLYFSLSLYYSGRVKGFREEANKKGGREDWVQLTTQVEEVKGGQEKQNSPRPALVKDQLETAEAQVKQEAQDLPKTKNEDEEEITTLRQQLQYAGEENEKLRQGLQTAGEENDNLALQTSDLLAQLSGLQNTLQEVSGQLEAKNNELGDARTRIAELTDRQTELERQILGEKAADEKVESLQSTLLKKTGNIEKANERIEALTLRADQTTRELAAAEKTIHRLQAALAASQATGEKESGSEEKMRQEILLTQQENRKLLAEIGSMQARMDDMKVQLSNLENGMKNAERKAEAMLRYGQEQDKKIAPSLAEIKSLKERLADQQEILAQTRQELELHKQGKLRVRQQLSVREEELDRLSGLQEELQQHSAEAMQAEKSLKEFKAAYEQSKEVLGRKEVKINELAADLETERTKSKAAEEKTSAMDKELEAVREELASAKSDGERLQNLVEQTAAERDQMQTALAENKENSEKISGDLASAMAQLQSVTSERDRTMAEMKEKNALIDQMSAQLKEAATDSLKMKKIQQEYQQAIQEKNKALKDAEKKSLSLTGQLETANNNLERVRQKADNLANKLAAADKKTAADALENNQLVEELKSLQVLADKRQKELERLQAEFARISKKNQDQSVALVVERQKNQKLQGRISELKLEADALQQAKEEAGHSREQVDSLTAELEARGKKLSGMQEESADLQARYESLQKEYDTLLQKTTDSDEDGVPDADDACPETPPGTRVDARGCEIDSDGDGLVDRLDLCPESTGSAIVNQFGCRPDKPIILQDVVFTSGTADLAPPAEANLEKVVRVLQEHPEIRIEIGGHTDNIGGTERNLTVSMQRAQSVKDYLVLRGVSEDRLGARGYGSKLPVADNVTPQGRSANRRVELRILSE